MANTGGWENVVFQPSFDTPGNTIQQGIQNKERLSEKYLALEAEQQNKTSKYGLGNLKSLNDTVNDIKAPLGNDYANQVMNQQASKVYQDLIEASQSTDPVTFDYLLHQKTDNLMYAHKQFSDDLTFANKSVDDLLKSNPNLDPNATKLLAQQQLESKHFNVDENGNPVLKHPDEVVNNQNPIAILNNPYVQGQLAIGGADVIRKYITAQKLQNADSSKTESNKGFVNSENYDIGYNPALNTLEADANGKPVIKPRTEEFHLGNGVTLKMLPESTFDEYMGDKQFNSAFQKLWNPMAAKIEQNFAKSGGAIDPASIKMLQRDYLKKIIDEGKMDLSFLQPKVKQVVPKPPHITINMGDKQAQMTGNWANSVVKAAAQDDNASVNKLVDQMYSGNGERKLMGTYTKVENGQPTLYIRTQLRKPKTGDNLDDDEKLDEQTTAIPANSPNAEALLLGQYQSIMGSNTKAESLPFKNNPVVPQKSTAQPANEFEQYKRNH